MTDLVDHLYSVVHPFFLRAPQRGKLVIQEANSSAKSKRFELHAGCRCVALQLDHQRTGNMDRSLPFFRCDVPGLTSKCDLIVFITNSAPDTGGRAFLVEMTSLNVGGSLAQMRASELFAKYIVEVARLQGIAVGAIDYRGVRIRTTRIPAKGTSRAPKPKFTRQSPGSFHFCDWDISFPLSLTALRDAG